MVNLGSPVSLENVVNSLEYVFAIREGQIRMYAYDAASSEWVPVASDPVISNSVSVFEVFVESLGNSTSKQMPSKECRRVLVISHPDNSKRIWIGGSDVSNTRGIPLEPGQSQELPLKNTNAIFAIAETSGDKVIIANVR